MAIRLSELKRRMTTDRTESNRKAALSLVGEDGKVHRDWHGAQLTIKAMVGYPGSRVTDLIIGGQKLQINNRLLAGIVVKAKKKPRPRPSKTGADYHRKGGQSRAASLTPERRTEIARAAAKTRWANRKSKDTPSHA